VQLVLQKTGSRRISDAKINLLDERDRVEFVGRYLAPFDHESAFVAYFDHKGGLISSQLIPGSGRGVRLPFRHIVSEALAFGCRALVLAHCHPSGDPNPSQTDIETTRQLFGLFRLLEIRIYDHLILVPGGTHSSFRSLGLL
jgi:DNA repair protein RadC